MSDSSSEGANQANTQGWGSWAWSYVPQILPYEEDYDEEEDSEGEKRLPQKPQPPVLAVGLYITQITVVFKVSETSITLAWSLYWIIILTCVLNCLCAVCYGLLFLQ